MTEWEALIPLAGYVFVTTVTPGPNNLMLAASGRQFGYRRTVPHMCGIATGFMVLQCITAIGLGEIIAHSDTVNLGLKIFGSAFLLYLMIGLVMPATSVPEKEPRQPVSLLEAALFQFANPKGWVMASTSIAIISSQDLSPLEVAGLLSAIFFLIGIPCNSLWILSGSTAKYWLRGKQADRLFTLAIAAFTSYAVFSIWQS